MVGQTRDVACGRRRRRLGRAAVTASCDVERRHWGARFLHRGGPGMVEEEWERMGSGSLAWEKGIRGGDDFQWWRTAMEVWQLCSSHARWTSSVSFRGEALEEVEEAPRSTDLWFCYRGGQIGGSHAQGGWLVHDSARGVRRRESGRMGTAHRARGRAETPWG
jgi:hypothetical protein